jgi:hypothetical protein
LMERPISLVLNPDAVVKGVIARQSSAWVNRRLVMARTLYRSAMASPAVKVVGSQQPASVATIEAGGVLAGVEQAAMASALITLAGAVQVEGNSRMGEKVPRSGRR